MGAGAAARGGAEPLPREPAAWGFWRGRVEPDAAGGVEWSNLHVALLGQEGPFLQRFIEGLGAPLVGAAALCFGGRAGTRACGG